MTDNYDDCMDFDYMDNDYDSFMDYTGEAKKETKVVKNQDSKMLSVWEAFLKEEDEEYARREETEETLSI